MNHVTRYVPKPKRKISYLPRLILVFITYRAKIYDIRYMATPTAKPSWPNLRKADSRAERMANPNLVQYMIADFSLVAGSVIFAFLDKFFFLLT